jgi:hypothetical protein
MNHFQPVTGTVACGPTVQANIPSAASPDRSQESLKLARSLPWRNIPDVRKQRDRTNALVVRRGIGPHTRLDLEPDGTRPPIIAAGIPRDVFGADKLATWNDVRKQRRKNRERGSVNSGKVDSGRRAAAFRRLPDATAIMTRALN